MAGNIVVNCRKQCKRVIKKMKILLLQRNGKKKDTMADAVVQKKTSSPVVWLVGTEDFGNLGDHAIAVAERHFLEKYFPDYELIEISARNYDVYRNDIMRLIDTEDIIIGTGGGNLGNQYPESERIRQDLIKTFTFNRIVIMPQTVWFSQDDEGKKCLQNAVELYGSHRRLTIAVRERFSYEFVKENFANRVVLVPDIVLFDATSIKKFMVERKKRTDRKAIICLRNDLEGKLCKSERREILRLVKKEFRHVKKIDTQKDYLISTEKREAELSEFFEELLMADIVLTDRLHGMVFAALAEIPCIVFDNYNQKVKGIYEWINELPYIRFGNTVSEVEKNILELKEMSEHCSFEVVGLEERFGEFARMIREEC